MVRKRKAVMLFEDNQEADSIFPNEASDEEYALDDEEDAALLEEEYGYDSSIAKENDPDLCWRKAISLLTKQDYTVYRMRQKLARSFSISAVQATIERACTAGYLNDQSYMERFILSRKESRSRLDIKRGLWERGIQVDENLLEELYPFEEEKAVALKLLERKYYRLLQEPLDRKNKQKLYQVLMRKGFSYDCIESIIRQVQDDFLE